MGKRTYVTAAQLHAASERLSARAWAVIEDVERLGVATGAQLRRLHYPDTESGQRSARKELTRLVELRALGRLDRRIGGVRAGSAGYVYRLDVLGQRLLDPERPRYRRPWTPGAVHLDHSLAVSELYVELATAHVDWKLLAYDTEPDCWREFTGPGGQPTVLKPDALVAGATADYEDRYFIEIDRGTESLTRIREKARLYVAYWQSGREQELEGVFPRVLWVSPNTRREQHIVKALAELDAEAWQLFAVTTNERARDHITQASTEREGGEA